FIKDILSGGQVVWLQPSTYARILSQDAFIQAFFNFMLLMPFGVYLRYFFNKRRHWGKSLGLGFLISLFFELTQLTGIYGIYICSYRIFDVDDLLLNSTGALFGFVIAPVLLAVFTARESLLANGKNWQKGKYISPLPQLLAIIVDYL